MGNSSGQNKPLGRKRAPLELEWNQTVGISYPKGHRTAFKLSSVGREASKQVPVNYSVWKKDDVLGHGRTWTWASRRIQQPLSKTKMTQSNVSQPQQDHGLANYLTQLYSGPVKYFLPGPDVTNLCHRLAPDRGLALETHWVEGKAQAKDVWKGTVYVFLCKLKVCKAKWGSWRAWC